MQENRDTKTKLEIPEATMANLSQLTVDFFFKLAPFGSLYNFSVKTKLYVPEVYM